MSPLLPLPVPAPDVPDAPVPVVLPAVLGIEPLEPGLTDPEPLLPLDVPGLPMPLLPLDVPELPRPLPVDEPELLEPVPAAEPDEPEPAAWA